MKKTTGYKVFIYLSILGVFLFSLNCSNPEEKPIMTYPGYSAKLIFTENFNRDLNNWYIEGKGSVKISRENRLIVEELTDTAGLAIWTKRDFAGDFLIEYEVEIPETAGINIAILCAQGKQGENILTELPLRTGKFEEYKQGGIYSYHIAYHCYFPDGRHNPRSTIRKNPGHLLLSQVEPDPCKDNRKYLIDIIKIGNRIQFFVDTNLIHDVRDKGGFGPIYTKGKIGFYIQGSENKFITIFDKICIFKLSPK